MQLRLSLSLFFVSPRIQIYDSKRGGFTELSMLDVMQIFGRAGRPQFDTSGEGIIITSHGKLNHYLGMLNHQMAIESQFIQVDTRTHLLLSATYMVRESVHSHLTQNRGHHSANPNTASPQPAKMQSRIEWAVFCRSISQQHQF